MSAIVVAGNTSGSVTLDAPAVAGTTVITLPTTSGTMVATDSSGNVGIGTTSPTVKLDVTGSAASSLEGMFTNTNTGTSASAGVRGVGNSTGQFILRQYGTNVTATVFGQTLANYAGLFSDGASSNGLLVGSLTADPVIFGTNNLERMRLDTSGNLQFNSGYGSVATAYGCRAWVNFNGTGTIAIRSSGNVSSITDGGAGLYTINFTNAMPDASYVISGTAQNDGSGTGALVLNGGSGAASVLTTSAAPLRLMTTNNNGLYDSTVVMCSVFR